MDSRVIQLTSAAHKDGNLNIRPCGKSFFPRGVFGGPARKDGLGRLVKLRVEGLDAPVATDIPTDRKTGRPRWIFRERKWVKDFVRVHGLLPGAEVVISRLDLDTYAIRPTKNGQAPGGHAPKCQLPPSAYCETLAGKYLDSSTIEHRKEKGQFFTPPEVAAFMAELSLNEGESPTRILDPGAGIGMLSCAVCERLAQNATTTEIHLDLYEDDRALIRYLEESVQYLASWLAEHGITLESRIIEEDFVLAANRLGSTKSPDRYDLVISNPPYLKIAGDDPRSLSVDEAVYGQPNLYALFMMTGMKALKDSGTMVFITPRSYTTGKYFEAFRRVFFARMTPAWVHVFDSRKDVFSSQSVLQENIILKATKAASGTQVAISTSKNSDDLHHPRVNRISLRHALVRRNKDVILRLPLNRADMSVLRVVDAWKETLSDYGLQISTGPVVPFRSREFIASSERQGATDMAPLLWMRNVRSMTVSWPCKNGGARDADYQFITDCEKTRQRRLLLQNGNMVLLRRFSTKDDQRRLVAAPLLKEELPFAWIGIENHLNYIFRPDVPLSADEAFGLAGILNSTLLDRYFRICNGNTQVGAAEIRAIPLPSIEAIAELGRRLRLLHSDVTQAVIDEQLSSIIERKPEDAIC
jgi:adenine-specific DNA-methyltransferase